MFPTLQAKIPIDLFFEIKHAYPVFRSGALPLLYLIFFSFRKILPFSILKTFVMRTAAFTLVFFVAFCYAANAQKFSLLPQVGFENSKTKIRYNDLPSFAPAGVVTSPQVGLQLTYKIKSGHGLFLGAASSRSIVPYSFSDPETGMTNYTTTTGDMQLRFESGYQFSSKPLFFKKSAKGSTQATENKMTEKKSCGLLLQEPLHEKQAQPPAVLQLPKKAASKCKKAIAVHGFACSLQRHWDLFLPLKLM